MIEGALVPREREGGMDGWINMLHDKIIGLLLLAFFLVHLGMLFSYLHSLTDLSIYKSACTHL